MRKPFNGDYLLTQGFGVNPDNYKQFGLKGHDGLDYGLPTGTIVVAPHNGKVIEAQNDPSGYGNYIKIENDKEGSVLAHLLSFLVNVGDTVIEGQEIASSDNTGNSTGPHLHWGYYLFPRDRSNGYAGFIDQSNLMEPMASITQTELDKMRNDRDTNYNNWQIDEQKIKDLMAQLTTANNNSATLQKAFDDYKTSHPDITPETVPSMPPTSSQPTPSVPNSTPSMPIQPPEIPTTTITLAPFIQAIIDFIKKLFGK